MNGTTRKVGWQTFKQREDGLWERAFPYNLIHTIRYFRMWLVLKRLAREQAA